jgi:hypothetical protein
VVVVILVLVTSTKLVAGTVVVNQVAVATVTVMQVLQRSDLVLVVLVLVSREVMVADHHQAVVDMVVERVVEAAVASTAVVAVEADDLCKNNQATSSICILLQIRKLQKRVQVMKCW